MKAHLRLVLTALSILVAASVSSLAAPEDAYLATRDKAVERLKKLQGDAGVKLESQTLASLEKQLRAIVGPKNFKELPAEGKITLETLSDGVGLGLLDGLSFQNADQSRHVIITTLPLTTAWLKAHKNWNSKRPLPDTVEEAAKSEEFHTQAFGSDAAFVLYGPLPVTGRSGFVQANLFAQSQDGSPPKPDSLIVLKVKDNLLLVSQIKSSAPIQPIPVCDALKRKRDSQAEVLLSRYNATGLKNQKLFDDYTRLQEQGDAEFKQCFVKNAAAQPWFRMVTMEAQAAADTLSD